MMRKGGCSQWKDLLKDVTDGKWQEACRNVEGMVDESMGQRNPRISYAAVYDMFAQAKLKLYSVSWQNGASHYNTVHLIRAVLFGLEVYSDQSAADWNLLCHMGKGMRFSSLASASHEVAVYLARRIGIQTGAPYSIEDLCCFACLLSCSGH